MIESQEIDENEENAPDDERMAEILVEIANDVLECKCRCSMNTDKQ